MTLQNQSTITQFLAGKGFTAAQIAGVEGNLQTESSGNPTASNPREGAIGIAQWEGGRRTALQSFARSAGTSETDLTTQLNFMWQELQTTEHGALTSLLAATTPTAAATAFQSQYERSSTASLPARIANANAIAAGGVQGGSGQVSTGGAGQGFTATNAGLSIPGLSSVLTWGTSALIVLVGAGLVILALSLLAKSSAGGSSTTVLVPGRRSAGKGGASTAAEDVAEVAA